MKTLYLCAVGNGEGIRLALTVNRAQRRWSRIVLLDDDEKKHGTVRLGLEVAGSFDLLGRADPASSEVVNLVTRTTEGRARARAKIARYDIPFASLVHPNVDLFGTEVGREVTLYQNASVGAEASVGESSVVLVGAVVGHGVRIGRSCVVAPNAVINARVRVEDRVYVGSNASVLPDLAIGEGATIAANSVVFSDVPPGATAIGAPASIIMAPGHGAGGDMPVEAARGTALGGEARAMPASGDGREAAGEPEEDVALEGCIVRIVRDVLGSSALGATANFFEIGCNSAKALQIWRRIQGESGRPLSIVDIYRHPSARALASFLGGSGQAGSHVRQAQQRASLRLRMRPRPV
jgi:sugar O-acyltransferase (sialic acid O-acetyltransferase NeuD family)